MEHSQYKYMDIIKKAKIYGPIVFFLALIIGTAISAFMPRPLKSGDLTTQKQKNENVIRIDYVDSAGRITVATDKGYATQVETREYESIDTQPEMQESKGALETQESRQKSDVKPAHRLTCSIITFLDESGQTVALPSGYDEIHRTFNDIGKADTDTYYLNGKQVARKQGYYQYARSYNADGKVSTICYMDQDGKPIDTTSGYAEIRRTYEGKGHTDMYFDTLGNPAKAGLGQYGQKVEKEDDFTITTYLDADGNPADTIKGYAIVRKENNKILYFDKYGNPVTIGRGQFGVEGDEDGQTVYLNEEGEPIFRIDNFLNTHPVVVLLLGILVTAIAALLKGKWQIAFLLLYVLFIVIMTIAYREFGDSRGQFVAFASFRHLFTNPSVRQNILNNIWLFVPLGAALYFGKRKWMWVVPSMLSILIESIQYFTGVGLFEIDDMITNGVGGVIGYSVSWAIHGLINDRVAKSFIRI